VEYQIRSRGIRDARVLAAMRKVPRHLFLAEQLWKSAHDDRPLPIGGEQTISQPYMVALMTEALELKGGETVLEVGTGSGYQTAILAELAALELREALDKLGEVCGTITSDDILGRIFSQFCIGK